MGEAPPAPQIEVEENMEVEMREDTHARIARLPPLDLAIAQQLLTFLSKLIDFGTIPTVYIAQASIIHPITTPSPNMGRFLDNDAFFHPLLGPVMTGTEHEKLSKFLKVKALVF